MSTLACTCPTCWRWRVSLPLTVTTYGGPSDDFVRIVDVWTLDGETAHCAKTVYPRGQIKMVQCAVKFVGEGA